MALVVDDEYLIAVELEAIMESSGYDVLSAINVHEARQLMDLRSIDVAVLNFRMKDGTLDLARDLAARGVPLDLLHRLNARGSARRLPRRADRGKALHRGRGARRRQGRRSAASAARG